MNLRDFLSPPPGTAPGTAPGGTTAGDDSKRDFLARILGLRPFDLTGPAPGGWTGPGPHATPGDLCDATISPVVTGVVDHDLLDRLAAELLGPASPPADPGSQPADPGRPPAAAPPGPGYARELILRNALALLSGPAGLASRLRTGRLTGPAASVSLPLDVGTATDTIPPHLRRAVILRDRHCAFPGCDQPPAACQVHHIIPRRQGGPTSLSNLLLTCSFHHLIAIHQWGWTLVLSADGSTAAISPDRSRTLRSHGPPQAA